MVRNDHSCSSASIALTSVASRVGLRKQSDNGVYAETSADGLNNNNARCKVCVRISGMQHHTCVKSCDGKLQRQKRQRVNLHWKRLHTSSVIHWRDVMTLRVSKKSVHCLSPFSIVLRAYFWCGDKDTCWTQAQAVCANVHWAKFDRQSPP